MMLTAFLLKILSLSFFDPFPPSSYETTPPVFSFDDLYVIYTAILNEEDYSEWYQDRNSYIKFYTFPDDDNIYMANVVSKSDSQSFGPISNLRYKKEIIDGDLIDIAEFDWHYENTYNDRTGIADVVFFKYPSEDLMIFVCMFTTENEENGLTVFSGPTLSNPEIDKQ